MAREEQESSVPEVVEWLAEATPSATSTCPSPQLAVVEAVQAVLAVVEVRRMTRPLCVPRAPSPTKVKWGRPGAQHPGEARQ